MASDQIDIIPSHRINRVKWDQCISSCSNDILYAHSYYLDHLAENWHGIVVNNYDGVMPVPWRKKLGIRYCYDVPFIQQLGYFTAGNIHADQLTGTFFSFIRYGHYNFNYSNCEVAGMPGVKSTTNLVIDLTDNKTIATNFTNGFSQGLQRAAANDLRYSNATPGEAIDLFRKLHSDLPIAEADYKNLMLLTEFLLTGHKCTARKIVNAGGQTLSIVLLLKDERRLYNIINAVTAEGRKTEANYLLYSKIFSEFSGKGLLIDLEGSELPGVKSFYKKMGAIDQPYFRMHINNLLFPLNLMKRTSK